MFTVQNVCFVPCTVDVNCVDGSQGSAELSREKHPRTQVSQLSADDVSIPLIKPIGAQCCPEVLLIDLHDTHCNILPPVPQRYTSCKFQWFGTLICTSIIIYASQLHSSIHPSIHLSIYPLTTFITVDACVIFVITERLVDISPPRPFTCNHRIFHSQTIHIRQVHISR